MNARLDFAEWLSPMVVKELRQGLRSRLFVSSFLLLQGAMILIAIIALAASAGGHGTGAVTGFFWTIIGVLLLLVMPIGGLGSVAHERKANTLELIFLTRLTARRILIGKWLAIVAQTVLLVCAVLPYAVLRYFMGGVDISTELVVLALLVVLSALFSGVTVGLSPVMSVIGRVFLVIGVVMALQFLLPAMGFFFRAMPVAGRPAMTWSAGAALVVLAVMVLLLMLEFGASKIAPPAVNHSTSRRLLGLGAVLLANLFPGWQTTSWPLHWLPIALLVPICISALCEQPSSITSVYRPFVRYGWAGKLAGRVLYPGWPSGVLFTVLVLVLLVGPMSLRAPATVEWAVAVWVAVTVTGTLLLPMAINYTFLRKLRRPLVVFVIFTGACAFLAAAASMMSAFNAADLRLLVALLPASGLFLTSTVTTSGFYHGVLIGTGIVTISALVLLLLQMWKPWHEIRALEAAASAAPAPTPSSDAPEPRPTV